MCGRSSLTKSEKELEARFKATFYSEDLERYNPLPNFNVAPSHVMPIISGADANHFLPMRWGLIPFWAKDASIASKLINARGETVAEKPAFRDSYKPPDQSAADDQYSVSHGTSPYFFAFSTVLMREGGVEPPWFPTRT